MSSSRAAPTPERLAKLRLYAENTDSGDRNDLLVLFAALDSATRHAEVAEFDLDRLQDTLNKGVGDE